MVNKWEKEFNLEALEQEIAQAKVNYQEAEKAEPCAEFACYDASQNLIVITLKNGAKFSFPPQLAQGLENASTEQLSNLWLSASGRSIHWKELDVDFSIVNLIVGIFGTEKWMSELGRKGGKVTSPAKKRASRLNGKKGGRPKKQISTM